MATLREFGVRLVVLAGFMRIVTPVLLDSFPDAVMNLHPALLPWGRGACPVFWALWERTPAGATLARLSSRRSG